MAYVNVAEWSPEHVADWLRGLDDEIQPYTQFFINNNINGCHLLTLCRDDLTNLNINKIGHQELVLEAVELLRQLHYNLTSETLQSLSLKLGCKSQSLFNNLKHLSQSSADSGKKERVSTETLSAVSDILNLVKSLISWLDRYPFVGQEKYVDVRKSVLKLSVELASTAQRDQFAEMPHEVIKECCLNLAAQSDKIVQEFNDSLIIQPASLEVAKVKRKVDDDLGIHINSSYTGIHIIEDVKFQSPAYRCGKIEEGDEIVQVNYQTVIGWQVKNIICAMREHPSEVHVTLKKRPRHPNVLGQVITLWPYRIPSKKTAFRKLYKWSKGKSTIDIRDVCPTAGEQRSDMNNVAVNGTLPANEKERNFPAGRSRSRIRRRATVTGVSPTLLQPPVSIEELMGSSGKKKESVGRTVSYDPSKIVNVEDAVFKKDSGVQDKDPCAENGVNGKPSCSSNIENGKEKNIQKGRFLLPPPEFHFGGQLTCKKPDDKEKEAPMKEVNSLSSKPAAFDQKSGEMCQGSGKYPIPAISVNKPYTHKNQPLPQENSKQLQVDRILKQEKKPDVSSIPHGDSNQEESSSASTLSQFVRDMSPSPRKSNKRTFQFPSRENPQAQEARSTKKIYDSKMPLERTDDCQVTKNSSVLKQQLLPKRNIQQTKNPDNSCVKPSKVKENQLSSKSSENCREQNFNLPGKDPDFYHYPRFLNYSSSHFQHQTHQSKIISLKSKAKENSNYAQAYNNPYLSSVAKYPSNNIPPRCNTTVIQQQQQQKPSTTVNSVPSKPSVGNKKSLYPQSFCSPSGRSLSFNNIAFSSDDSCSDDYEIYEEINERPPPSKPIVPPKPPQLRPENNPAFAAKIAEVYSMLCQGNSFLPAHKNNNYGNTISPESSAMIDELARRMYLALQMNHLKSQTVDQSNYVQPTRGQHRYVHPNNMVPQNHYYQHHINNVPKGFTEQCPPQVNVSYLNLYNTPHNSMKTSPDSGYATLNHADIVNGQPLKLPTSDPLLNRHSNMFKSATSQEIHNLYTSQGANKSAPGTHDSHYFSKQMSSDVHQNGNLFLDPTYEVLSAWQNRKQSMFSENKKDGSNIRSGNYSENTVICPAEKESENELPCRDTPEANNPEAKTSESFASSDSPGQGKSGFTLLKKDTYSFEEQGKTVPELPRNKECIFSGTELKNSEKLSINGEEKTGSDKKLQPTIMTLMSSMPKPPKLDDNDATVTKSSSAQTDIDMGDTETTCFDSIHIKTNNVFCENSSTINDESFPSSLNCSQISAADSTNVSYSSSLNSSPSGSVISSAGSCYYYADTRTQSQMGSHLPSVSSDIMDEDSLPEALRSSVLPTMGVSMLSKKRNSSSSSSSEPGSIIRPSTCTSLMLEESAPNMPKIPGIITDVEHTF